MAATYATVANVTARLGTQRAARLTADSGSTPTDAIIQAATDAAQGELDSYLVERFLGISGDPADSLRGLASRIATASPARLSGGTSQRIGDGPLAFLEQHLLALHPGHPPFVDLGIDEDRGVIDG